MALGMQRFIKEKAKNVDNENIIKKQAELLSRYEAAASSTDLSFS